MHAGKESSFFRASTRERARKRASAEKELDKASERRGFTNKRKVSYTQGMKRAGGEKQ